MSNAINIKCPVEMCKADVGQRCKLVDMFNNQMVGGWHLARVREAAHADKAKKTG